MNFKTPLVSILIPAFNAQEWITDTLISAIGQTWQKKEVIVVDDGSSDNTLSIARRFASARVSVIHQDNQGAAAARNRALAASQGDFIQWLDADDLLHCNKIAAQIEMVGKKANPRTLLSSAWGMFMHRPHKAQFVPTALWCDLSPVEWLTRKMEENLYMQTATWLVSRQLSEAAGPWNTTLLGDDDGEYFSRVIINSNFICFVPEAKVFYRMPGPSSLSYVGMSNRKLDAQFRSMELTISYLRSKHESERVRAACVKYIHDWLANFVSVRPDLVKRFEAMVVSLGGELYVPKLPTKYIWIRLVFGWKVARIAQIQLPRLRWSLVRSIDKMMHYVECRKSGSL